MNEVTAWEDMRSDTGAYTVVSSRRARECITWNTDVHLDAKNCTSACTSLFSTSRVRDGMP